MWIPIDAIIAPMSMIAWNSIANVRPLRLCKDGMRHCTLCLIFPFITIFLNWILEFSVCPRDISAWISVLYSIDPAPAISWPAIRKIPWWIEKCPDDFIRAFYQEQSITAIIATDVRGKYGVASFQAHSPWVYDDAHIFQVHKEAKADRPLTIG
jgi:hypothetical protein